MPEICAFQVKMILIIENTSIKIDESLVITPVVGQSKIRYC